MDAFLFYLTAINVVTYFTFGYDKRQAKKEGWRVSERTLLVLTWVGGSLGALFGMSTFRHKTKHKLFKIMVPLAVFVHIAMIYYGMSQLVR